MELKDKHFFVTGGGNGLGRELALALLRESCRVTVVDINAAALGETVRLAGNGARIEQAVADVSDAKAVCRLAENIDKDGGVDGVINNAGIIQPFVRVESLPHDAAKRIMRINFGGTLHITQAFLPQLRRRTESALVNVSSMGGFVPVPGQAVYSASKAAVKMLSESLAMELRDTGVNVLTVYPGAMATDIKKNSGLANTPPSENSANVLRPSEAAQMIVDAIAKDMTELYVGEDSRLMKQLCDIDPKRAVEAVAQSIHHKL